MGRRLDAETLSDKAASVEKRYFHKFYTDMDTVEIHHFKERNELLENSVELLEKAAQGDFEFLDYQVKILSTSYYYITSDTTSEYYYVGKTHLPEWSRSIGIITSGTAVKWTMARKVERVLGITIMDRLCMRESSKKESRAEKALTMMKMAI